MAESEYCDDYYEYMNDDCDGDCDECMYKECDEHPHQKYRNKNNKSVKRKQYVNPWQ